MGVGEAGNTAEGPHSSRRRRPDSLPQGCRLPGQTAPTCRAFCGCGHSKDKSVVMPVHPPRPCRGGACSETGNWSRKQVLCLFVWF